MTPEMLRFIGSIMVFAAFGFEVARDRPDRAAAIALLYIGAKL